MTLIDWRKREIELVKARYGNGAIETGPQLEWVQIRGWKLPAGWNKTETTVMVLVPPGHPVTPPDNFYADNDLRLASGNPPSNASPDQEVGGKRWLLFSYHVEAGDWKAHSDPLRGHNLLTFLEGIARRFQEPN